MAGSRYPHRGRELRKQVQVFLAAAKTLNPRAPALLLLVLTGLTVAACSEGAGLEESSPTVAVSSPQEANPAAATPTPEQTSEPSPTNTPDLGPAELDSSRIHDSVEYLANEIGPRPAGSESETRAAEWLRDRFEDLGYKTEIVQFTFGREYSEAALTIGSATDVPAIAVSGSPAAEASGPLVYAGLARLEDLEGLELEGSIVLADRGIIRFSEKAFNVQERGAAGLVVINTDEGPFLGLIDPAEAPSIPVAGVAGADRDRLLAAAEAGETASLSTNVEPETLSRNVVAGDRPCSIVLGAHYDSVPGAPGANDNASGTSTVLELARVMAARGETEGLCFVAFGAEELGLFGSQHFVISLDQDERATLQAMLNFDITGAGDAVEVIGDQALTDLALQVAGRTGAEAVDAEFPSNASSDHASFLEAGIPAVTFTSGDFAFFHTPEDTPDKFTPESLLNSARLGLQVLLALRGA